MPTPIFLAHGRLVNVWNIEETDPTNNSPVTSDITENGHRNWKGQIRHQMKVDKHGMASRAKVRVLYENDLIDWRRPTRMS